MTADDLHKTWGERDDRYARWRSDLSADAVASVRSWRVRETEDLEPRQRGRLAMEALVWTPPPWMAR